MDDSHGVSPAGPPPMGPPIGGYYASYGAKAPGAAAPPSGPVNSGSQDDRRSRRSPPGSPPGGNGHHERLPSGEATSGIQPWDASRPPSKACSPTGGGDSGHVPLPYQGPPPPSGPLGWTPTPPPPAPVGSTFCQSYSANVVASNSPPPSSSSAHAGGIMPPPEAVALRQGLVGHSVDLLGLEDPEFSQGVAFAGGNYPAGPSLSHDALTGIVASDDKPVTYPPLTVDQGLGPSRVPAPVADEDSMWRPPSPASVARYGVYALNVRIIGPAPALQQQQQPLPSMGQHPVPDHHDVHHTAPAPSSDKPAGQYMAESYSFEGSWQAAYPAVPHVQQQQAVTLEGPSHGLEGNTSGRAFDKFEDGAMVAGGEHGRDQQAMVGAHWDTYANQQQQQLMMIGGYDGGAPAWGSAGGVVGQHYNQQQHYHQQQQYEHEQLYQQQLYQQQQQPSSSMAGHYVADTSAASEWAAAGHQQQQQRRLSQDGARGAWSAPGDLAHLHQRQPSREEGADGLGGSGWGAREQQHQQQQAANDAADSSAGQAMASDSTTTTTTPSAEEDTGRGSVHPRRSSRRPADWDDDKAEEVSREAGVKGPGMRVLGTLAFGLMIVGLVAALFTGAFDISSGFELQPAITAPGSSSSSAEWSISPVVIAPASTAATIHHATAANMAAVAHVESVKPSPVAADATAATVVDVKPAVAKDVTAIGPATASTPAASIKQAAPTMTTTAAPVTATTPSATSSTAPVPKGSLFSLAWLKPAATSTTMASSSSSPSSSVPQPPAAVVPPVVGLATTPPPTKPSGTTDSSNKRMPPSSLSVCDEACESWLDLVVAAKVDKRMAENGFFASVKKISASLSPSSSQASNMQTAEGRRALQPQAPRSPLPEDARVGNDKQQPAVEERYSVVYVRLLEAAVLSFAGPEGLASVQREARASYSASSSASPRGPSTPPSANAAACPAAHRVVPAMFSEPVKPTTSPATTAVLGAVDGTAVPASSTAGGDQESSPSAAAAEVAASGSVLSVADATLIATNLDVVTEQLHQQPELEQPPQQALSSVIVVEVLPALASSVELPEEEAPVVAALDARAVPLSADRIAVPAMLEHDLPSVTAERTSTPTTTAAAGASEDVAEPASSTAGGGDDEAVSVMAIAEVAASGVVLSDPAPASPVGVVPAEDATFIDTNIDTFTEQPQQHPELEKQASSSSSIIVGGVDVLPAPGSVVVPLAEEEEAPVVAARDDAPPVPSGDNGTAAVASVGIDGSGMTTLEHESSSPEVSTAQADAASSTSETSTSTTEEIGMAPILDAEPSHATEEEEGPGLAEPVVRVEQDAMSSTADTWEEDLLLATSISTAAPSSPSPAPIYSDVVELHHDDVDDHDQAALADLSAILHAAPTMAPPTSSSPSEDGSASSSSSPFVSLDMEEVGVWDEDAAIAETTTEEAGEVDGGRHHDEGLAEDRWEAALEEKLQQQDVQEEEGQHALHAAWAMGQPDEPQHGHEEEVAMVQPPVLTTEGDANFSETSVLSDDAYAAPAADGITSDSEPWQEAQVHDQPVSQ